jgi:hypothetical protein
MKTQRLKNLISITVILVLLTFCFSCTKKFGEGNVDLSKWKAVNYNVEEQPYAEWVLSEDKLSVTQTVNADPSVFVSDLDLGKTSIQGTWYVNSSDDDDFIGFVFAYQDPGHFYLFDWKGAEQESARQGMAIKIVDASFKGPDSGNLDANLPFTNTDLWTTDGSEGKITLLHFEPTVGWQYQKPYKFQLDFQPGVFSIIVKDGEQILFDKTLEDNTYKSGKFGFYNYSQGGVVYEGFETVQLATGFSFYWILLLVIVLIIVFIGLKKIQPQKR